MTEEDVNDIEFRLNKIIDDLTARRETLLNDYLVVLESYDGGRAADHAGMLHDLDKHITNCYMEIKRVEGMKKEPRYG